MTGPRKYQVIFDVEAQSEAVEAMEYIATSAPLNAIRWYQGLVTAIESLEIFPKRCARAPESRFLGQELRHYIYKSHRIIFRIETKTRIVRVLHVRHASRRTLGEIVQY